MNLRYYLSAILIAIPFLCAAQETAPNILVIITDQHSGTILNQRGYTHIQTPGIDKIADQGVVFTRSYCTYPVCTASRKSFMTGMMPSKATPTNYPSIASLLAENGYETAYRGKWHVGSTDIDNVSDWHGFQTYQDGHDDTEISSWSTDFLKQEHSKPFFLITSFLNPHDCCELARNIAGENDSYHDGAVVENMDTASCPPLPFNFAIPENEAEGISARRNQDPGDKYWDTNPYKGWTESQWRQYMYGYDRLVEKVDAHVKEVIDELENQGLLENTIIIYTSDHGDGHASHQWTQKKNFYEEVINIPFIVSWKGKTKAGAIDEETLVSNGLDMYPTILKMAGIDIPEYLPGENLSASFLSDPGDATLVDRDYVISEIDQSVVKSNTPGSFLGRMVVTKKFKYFLFDNGAYKEQLFDLENDPGELNPVTYDPAYKDDLLACRAMLREWITSTDDDFDMDAALFTIKYDVKRLNNAEPIITEEMFTIAGASEVEGEDINGPSAIRIPDWIAPENRADPTAKYYCYFAHHAGDYIRMAWAADIEGPYHLYDVGTGTSLGDRGVLDLGDAVINLDNGIVIPNNHLASPDALVDNENQRIILYFHSGSSTYVNGTEVDKQLTYVSHSPYGLEFYDNIQPVFLGNSYFRVFEYDNELYALTNDGTPYKARDANAPWTAPSGWDFTDNLWDSHPNNPFQADITGIDGIPSSELRVRHTAVRLVADELQVFYSRRGDLMENIQMSTIDLSVGDWTQWDATYPPYQILQSTPGWEGGDLTTIPSETASAPEDVNQLRDPYLFEDSDGSLYLFYTGRGEDAIGLAQIFEVHYNYAPHAPSTLLARAISPTEVNLSWADNAVNEQGFKIERKEADGAFGEIASLNTNSTSFSDSDLQSSTSYTYRIYAYNEEGNSGFSNEASASTFSTDFVTNTYSVTADTYVRGGESTDLNYGSEENLIVKTGSKEDFFRKTLVKFDLSQENLEDENIMLAILRLYANKTEDCNIIASEIDDSWTELEVTWTNAPVSGNDLASTAITSNNKYYEWDITTFLQSEMTEDGVVSVCLQEHTGAGADVYFNSKEASNNHPELILSISNETQNTSIDIKESVLNVYPNPARNILNINISAGTLGEIKIYSLTGSIVYNAKNLFGETSINIEHLDSGIYFLQANGEFGTRSIKFVKTL